MDDATNRTAIKEAHFAAGNAMLGVVLSELGELYPVTCRMPSMPLFSEVLRSEYDRKFTKARSFLYEQRNLVQNKWLLRYAISRRPKIESLANTELHGLLITGSLDRLYENLTAYTPVMFASNCIGISEAIKTKLGFESDRLAKFLEKYNATFLPGVTPLEQDLD